MMKLFIEDIDMYDNNQRKEYLNNKLKDCKTTEDFIKLQTEMNDLGFGNWFHTKRGVEINGIWTNKEKGYYCSYPYGETIKKNGKDAVAYDTVRDATNRILTVDSLYKYWVIY